MFSFVAFVYNLNVICAKGVVGVCYMFGGAGFRVSVYMCVLACSLALVLICLPHCPLYTPLQEQVILHVPIFSIKNMQLLQVSLLIKFIVSFLVYFQV